MKRYISLDLLRGLAIIMVLFFHMLQVVYNYENVIATGDFPWPFWSLAIFLGFFGQANVLFIALSGLVNTISIDKQWQTFQAQNPTVEDKKAMTKKIMKTQLIRGLFILAMAFIYGVFLDRLLLGVVRQQPTSYAIGGLYWTNVLFAIAWGVIISGVVYTRLLCSDKSPRCISKRLLYVTVGIFVLTPILAALSHFLPFFYDSWISRPWEWSAAYVFINSILKGTTPLFPFAAFAVLGAVLGSQIGRGKVEKAVANRWIKILFSLFIVGLILYLPNVLKFQALVNLPSDSLPYYFIDSMYGVGEELMVGAGSLVFMFLLIYSIDVKGRAIAVAKRTVFIRRFGLVSLTVFSLQWVIGSLLLVYSQITNFFSGAATPFLESNFAAGWFDFQRAPGLSSYELVFWFAITFFVWNLFLWSWEKFKFKGSFEWLTVKLLSSRRKDAGDRLKVEESLYAVEPIIQEPYSFWSRRQVLGLWVLFIIMAAVEVALYALTM